MLRRLFNNCGLKLLAIVCSVALTGYVYIYVNPPVNQTLFLAIHLRGLDSKLALAGSTPDLDRVRVRLRGPLRSIRQLTQRKLMAQLDCSEVDEPGTPSLRVGLPDMGDVVVVDISPALFTLQVERRVELSLPIGIERRGAVADGLVLTGEAVTPGHVTLSGPSSVIVPVHTAQIEPDIQGISVDLVREYPVKFYGTDGVAVILPPAAGALKSAKYTARVSPKSSIRVVNLIPEFTGSLPPDLLLVSSTPRPQVVPVDAALAGSSALFARTEPIDLSKISKSSTSTVKVLYPFKIPVGSTLPQECDVDIVVEPFDQVGALRVKVELRGALAKQECVINPPELVLRSAEFADLTAQQRAAIHAVVDVSGLKPGEYRLAPQVSVPPELDRIKLDPSTVVVTIIPQGG